MKTALIAIASMAVVWLVIQVWQVLFVFVVALMLVGMLNPVVEKMEKRGLGRGVAIAIVFGAIFFVVGGVGVLTLPRIVKELGDLSADFPASQQRLAAQLEASKITAPIAPGVRSIHAVDLTEKAKELGIAYGPKAVEIVAYGASAFFLALYLLIDRDRMRGALFAVVPRSFHVRLSRVLLNLETIVGGYMRGQAITSVLMALFTFVVLMIAGVPNALALAIFAGVVDVLPYVGALLACLPAFVSALPTGITNAVIVLAILAAYQEFESRLIVPRIYGKALRLPAATVMIALLIGGKLLGILGALLALPIAAGIRMVIEELRVELPGEDVDDSEVRAKDAEAEAEFEARAAGVPATEAATIATEIATAERRAEEIERSAVAAPEKGPTPVTAGKPL